MPPYASSETTPSWMRAPAPSLRPTIGAPTDSARSITLWIFSANTSPSAPPNTVKSWLNTNTLRPSTVPQPVTTPSVSGRFASIPNPWARWRASMSSSTNESGSSRSSIRSRAVSLPRSCCRSTAAALPACSACSRSSASCSSRSSIGWTGSTGSSTAMEAEVTGARHGPACRAGPGRDGQTVSCGCRPRAAGAEPCWISTFRALACSATGMVMESTPAS